MKYLFRYSFFLLFSVVFFTACNKENLDEIVITDPGYEPDGTKVNTLLKAITTDNSNQSATLNCLTMVYPISLELKSGSVITVGSNADFEAALNASADNRAVDIRYPLTVIDARGTSIQVQSNAELGRNFASCIPQTGWAAAMTTNETLPACYYSDLFCFDLIYPLSLVDEDENISTVENEAQLIDVFATTEGPLSFILPIAVVDEDGVESSIANIDQFFGLIAQCNDLTAIVTIEEIQFQGFVCYNLVYPVTMLDNNGNLVTVNNADEYALLVLGGEPLQLQLPFSFVNSDGVVFNITDLDSYVSALNACGLDIEITYTGICDIADHVLLFINRGGPSMSPCRFNINYPVQLLAGGTTFTVNNIVEYYGVYNQFQLNEIQVVFPVSVTVMSTGQEIQFEVKNDLCEYIDDCE